MGCAAGLFVAALASPAAGAVKLETLALSDALPYNPHDPIAIANVRDVCPKPSKATLSTRFGPAISQATRMLDRGSSAKARSAMLRSARARTPSGAREVAAAALLENRPLAALAALLDAEARTKDSQTLVDLAAVLNDLGMPRQALAVLGRVHRFAHLPTPMGIPLQAVLRNEQGLALLRLGHFAQAKRVLGAATRQAPLLHAAAVNLADARICTGGGTAPPVWVDPPIEPPVPDPSGTETRDDAIDLSQGVDGVLPPVVYPTDPSEDQAALGGFGNMASEATNDDMTTDTRRGQLDTKWAATNPSALSLVRVATLTTVQTALLGAPAIDGIQSRITADENLLNTTDDNLFGDLAPIEASCDGAPDFDACFHPPCEAALKARHSEWHGEMNQFDGDIRSLFALQYHDVSGVAANIADPNENQSFLLSGRMLGDFDFQTLMGEATLSIKPFANACGPEPDGTADASLSEKGSPACPAAVKSIKFTVDLEVAKLVVRCEEVGLGIETPGPISLFAQISHNERTGTTTIVAGGKVGLKFPGGFGVSSSTGIYVTADSSGNFTDAGGRVSPISGSESGGGGSLSAGPNSMDFSFANAFE